MIIKNFAVWTFKIFSRSLSGFKQDCSAIEMSCPNSSLFVLDSWVISERHCIFGRSYPAQIAYIIIRAITINMIYPAFTFIFGFFKESISNKSMYMLWNCYSAISAVLLSTIIWPVLSFLTRPLLLTEYPGKSSIGFQISIAFISLKLVCTSNAVPISIVLGDEPIVVTRLLYHNFICYASKIVV